MEGIRACKHAMKSFTPQELGEGNQNAGGAKARSRRFEVLDRLAPLRAGLSPAQKNDWHTHGFTAVAAHYRDLPPDRSCGKIGIVNHIHCCGEV